MNLQKFINYRKNCPLCDSDLATGFHSRRRQIIKFEDDKITATFTMDPINRFKKTYQVVYSFNKLDNSFCVDFINQDGNCYEKEVPLFLLDMFRNFNSNLKRYRFFRECTFCMKYEYYSNHFFLPTNDSVYPLLSVNEEHLILSKAVGNNHRFFKLVNNLEDNKSQLLVIKDHIKNITMHDWSSWAMADHMKLPLIPFVSKNKTLERLDNLLIFS